MVGYDRDRRFQEIDKNDTARRARRGDEENIPRLPLPLSPLLPSYNTSVFLLGPPFSAPS